MLARLLEPFGRVETLEVGADAFWDSMVSLRALPSEKPLWRVNVLPSVVAALEPMGAEWLFDWAGGLVWIARDGDPGTIRDIAALETRIRRPIDPHGVFETGRF